MTQSTARIAELREQLHLHLYQYHVLNEPLITDGEYDALYNELQQLEAEHPELITPDSPTQRAGSDLSSGFEKVRHPSPILSLSNVYNEEEIRAWEERNLKLLPTGTQLDYTLEPKLDGLTIVITYENGLLTQAATRGNGEIGDVVTHNIRTVRSVPLRIPVDPRKGPPAERLVVRGEVMLLKKDFDAINERQVELGLPVYINARNTASGTLKQKDSRITATRPLTAYLYTVVESVGITLDKQWDMLEYMRDMGFQIAPGSAYYPTINDIIQQIPTWESHRNQLDFEIDGVVIKVNNLRVVQELGIVGKDPRGATAYKFPAQEATTRLLEHTASVGRTGRVIPNAKLEPVFIGGVTVSNATLHNYDLVKALDIRVGDHVVVKRAGDVIPNVIGPVVASRNGTEIPILPPTHCPFCQTEIVNPEGMVDYYCPNVYCSERVYRQVEFFVSRGALDIDGLGAQTVKLLIDLGLIRDEADLFGLKAEQLTGIEGFGEKKITNLMNGIEAAKSRTFTQVLTALGMEGVGSTVAALLANTFGSMEALLQATPENFLEIAGIGDILANGIYTWLQDPYHRGIIDKLTAAGVNMQGVAKTIMGDSLDGKIFVITGALPTLSRDEATEMIEAHGGKVSGSVSKKTSYVLMGDSPGSKAEKAAQLGVPIISEEEFLMLINAG